MDWKLEVVVVPVADVDRAVRFYEEQAGFVKDHDTQATPQTRIVQLTPRGSACSIVLMTPGFIKLEPGSLQGVQLVVTDIEAARAELVGRGVEASPIRHVENGEWVEGPGGVWNSFFSFSDPDGNGWSVQLGPGAQ